MDSIFDNMDIRKNVKKIEKYFQLFTITEGVAYILMKYPDKWVMPKIKTNKIEIKKDDKLGVYYYTTLNNDPEILFKLAENTIELNRKIEEKRQLLLEKMDELKRLFANEDLEKLKGLKYDFTVEGNDDEKEEESIANTDEIALKEIEKASDVVPSKEENEEDTKPVEEETVIEENKEEVVEESGEEVISDANADSIIKMAKKIAKGK